MRREIYNIFLEGQPTTKLATKHAWNSACREVEKIVREKARAEGCFYRLTNSDSRKVENRFSIGWREWTNDKGQSYIYTISLETREEES